MYYVVAEIEPLIYNNQDFKIFAIAIQISYWF